MAPNARCDSTVSQIHRQSLFFASCSVSPDPRVYLREDNALQSSVEFAFFNMVYHTVDAKFALDDVRRPPASGHVLYGKV